MLLLGLLLIVFPLGSFLYLKAGFNYRVESLSELEPLGSIEPFGLPVSTVEDPLVYVLYFSPSAFSDSVGISVQNVHEAFTLEPSVKFVGFGEGGYKLIDDTEQASQIAYTSEMKIAFQKLTSNSPHCENVPLIQQGIIVDREGKVRRCYDLHSGPEVIRMVEHLTILVPPPPIEDVFLEREKEY